MELTLLARKYFIYELYWMDLTRQN
jgi:hypothetical protein